MKKHLMVLILTVAMVVGVLLPAYAQEPLYTVSGHVFLDANCNCTCDEEEGPLAAEQQYVIAGKYYSEVGEGGTYSLQLPPGTYRIRVVMHDWWQYTPTGMTFLVLTVGEDLTGVDFGFTLYPTGKLPPPRVFWPLPDFLMPESE